MTSRSYVAIAHCDPTDENVFVRMVLCETIRDTHGDPTSHSFHDVTHREFTNKDECLARIGWHVTGPGWVRHSSPFGPTEFHANVAPDLREVAPIAETGGYGEHAPASATHE